MLKIESGLFPLSADGVHVWTFHWPSLPDGLWIQTQKWLSPEEKAQAARYKIPDDRLRFSFGRFLLRFLSGHYLGLDGKDLQMGVAAHGKPYWQEEGEKLRFNVSHSGSWIAMAFAQEREIGIDVQMIDKSSRFNSEKIAGYAFHPLEVEAVKSAPAEEKMQIFFNIWACKESVIKMTGTGLHGALGKFSVLPVPEQERWQIIGCQQISPMIKMASIRMLAFDENYAGAVCIQGTKSPHILKIRSWDDLRQIFE
ncbi:MAG: hypothetical protein CO093_01210 [Alphaproteobacteria bacterium CG_4_9_14_3_um_filter_47_13]|nr:MAG: hypothetical protein CO093_01210 [Alphaproteobacteria bacterium CG_4_9_14_3_um_filter_47_13]